MGDCIWELQVVMTGTEKGDVVDGKGNWVTVISEFYLAEGGDAIMLRPFRKTSANIHADHCPIIDDSGEAQMCQCILLLVEVVDHGNSDRFFEICESLPVCYLITDNVDRAVPLICGFVGVFEWIAPGESAVWVAVVEAFVTVSYCGGR